MNDIDTTEINFEDVPEEVVDFLCSTEYKDKVGKLSDMFYLSEDNKRLLDGCIAGLLTQTMSDDEVNNILRGVISTPELVESLRKEIDKEFIVSAYSSVRMSLEEDELEESLEKTITSLNQNDNIEESKKVEAPSPMQALANIQERLTKPSTIAPITRDYSVTRPVETNIPKADTIPRAPSLDIYREAPDK